MFSRPFAICFATTLGLGLSALAAMSAPARAPGAARPPVASPTVDFERNVQPLLAARCLACHGPNQRQGGLRLDRREDALLGGDHGPALVPGRAAASLLIRYVSGQDPKTVMPPDGERLTVRQVALLTAWIDQGAGWEGEKSKVKSQKAKEGTARSSNPQPHWAFLPVKRPAVPKLPGRQGVHPVDAFVRARFAKLRIRPAPEADRPTLIRRLSLDLTGLLPAPAEVDAFVSDRQPGAYERLVDRLLASPHFGERWGRHWLDLARYADSDGYEKDSPRPFAYVYRDWVIEALNRDMPFDEFTVQQLAGDMLAQGRLEIGDWRSESTGPASPISNLQSPISPLIATGFHRNTLSNREGGVDPEEFRVKAVVDRVNTTGAVWLGLTVGCAECHSHKYDPISHREYYGLYAFFNNADELDLPLAVPGAAGGSDAPIGQATPAAKPAAVPAGPKAPTLAERAEPRPTHIHLRGDFLRKGDPVEPHTPSVLPPLKPAGAKPTRLDLARWMVSPGHPLTARVTVNRVWQQLFGQGLVRTADDFGTRGERPSHPELLDYLASVFVSGDGMAGEYGSVGVGKYGSGRIGLVSSHSHTPTLSYSHTPWSLKSLIRLVVTSATYRQSSRVRPELGERDPRNVLLARQNRFRPEAETVRDLYLSASGLLNTQIGGPSIRPPLPADIAALGYANAVKWPESAGRDKYRRGMYIFFQRTVPYPMLAIFDAPDSNSACTRRERSNTPLQALTLLNDPVFFECAQALTRRLLTECQGTAEDRVRYAFRICLSREPTATETTRLLRLHAETQSLAAADPDGAAKVSGASLPPGVQPNDAAAWVAVSRSILNLDEFLTRE